MVAFDQDQRRSALLNDGELPISEPGLAELLHCHRNHIRFTSEIEEIEKCSLIYISNDVSTDTANQSDVSAITRLVETIVSRLKPNSVLVILSQVPPGFTRQLVSRFENELSQNGIQVYYQVETLVFGNAVERATKPERFIVGCMDSAVGLVDQYQQLLSRFGCPILRMGYESAELAKIAINSMLVSAVSATNMLAEICEKIGADWSEIAPALRLDKRIGSNAYLNPGLGIAGGNLERDLATLRNLAQERGTDAGLVDEWIELSSYRRDWVLRILHREIMPLRPKPVVAVWGLAYKADTDSIRNSPALAMVETLVGFTVRAYDPIAVLPDRLRSKVLQCASALEASRGADVLIVMTPWPEFSSYDVSQLNENMAGHFLIDPFGMLASRVRGESNLSYFRLGAPALRGTQ